MKAEQLMNRSELIKAALQRMAYAKVPLDTSKGDEEAFQFACAIYGVECVGHPKELTNEVLYRHAQSVAAKR